MADAFPKWELGRDMGILSMIIAAAFVVGSANLPVATQIRFTNAICFVFWVSEILSIPAIIVSALWGTGMIKSSFLTIPPPENNGQVFTSPIAVFSRILFFAGPRLIYG